MVPSTGPFLRKKETYTGTAGDMSDGSDGAAVAPCDNTDTSSVFSGADEGGGETR